MNMEEGEPEELQEFDIHSTAKSNEQLVLTNVPWKSWIPRVVVGISLILGACLVVGKEKKKRAPVVLSHVISGFRPNYWNIALVMGILGTFFIYKTKAETYVFDMASTKFVWTRRTVLSVERREFWFTDIQSVTVVELSDGQGGGDPNLYVKMYDGTRVKIFSGQLITIRDKSRIKAKRAIDDFLERAAQQVSRGERQRNEAPIPVTSVPERFKESVASNSPNHMQKRVNRILGRTSSRALFRRDSARFKSQQDLNDNNRDDVPLDMATVTGYEDTEL